MARLALNKPIVTVEWIYLACQSGQLEPAGDYIVPPFTGLRISLTGFQSLARRNALLKLVVKNGGEPTADLDEECTHLVIHVPLPASKYLPLQPSYKQAHVNSKYSAAKKRHMNTVSEQWLLQSAEKKGFIIWNEADLQFG